MKLSNFVVSGLDKALLFYQKYVSPLFPPSCRFEPTCSEYARQALRKYGLWKGGFLALRRLMRCNPYFPGGYDPVK